jgi:hypothetical protein
LEQAVALEDALNQPQHLGRIVVRVADYEDSRVGVVTDAADIVSNSP